MPCDKAEDDDIPLCPICNKPPKKDDLFVLKFFDDKTMAGYCFLCGINFCFCTYCKDYTEFKYCDENDGNECVECYGAVGN